MVSTAVEIRLSFTRIRYVESILSLLGKRECRAKGVFDPFQFLQKLKGYPRCVVRPYSPLSLLQKMEGACGKILDTEDPRVVIKKVHRRNRPQQRTCSLRAPEQARMQKWANNLCHEERFRVLYVPRAWDIHDHEYKMERIDVTKPIERKEIASHAVLHDLQLFYKAAKKAKIFPLDFELYEQQDGRVAMIDFDKFSTWEKGVITTPWGVLFAEPDLIKDLAFPLEDATKI